MDKSISQNPVEVLTGQLPRYFRPVIEFQEILKAHGYGLSGICDVMTRLQENFYLSTCDEETVAYYENLFGLRVRLGDTLDFRKERLLQKFNTVVPFSIGFLKAKLGMLYGTDGYTLDVDSVESILRIKVTSDRYGAIDLLYDLLWDVVPAHMKIIANQETVNTVPGFFNVAGGISSAFEQTIYEYTVTDIEGKAHTTGGMSGTVIKKI